MSKKVMVVDDETDVLLTISQTLEMYGYEVIKAKDGKDCINKLSELNIVPDLVLLDIIMPELSGWDVAAKIKENPKWKNIPIIFLGTKDDTMSIGMGNLAGEDYIQKPFDIKDLRLSVDRVLGANK